jgi:phage terminase Nu1 subunit (DNA packaging protein)
MGRQTFTSADIIAICGINASTLQALASSGKITPSVSFGNYADSTIRDYISYLKERAEVEVAEAASTTPEKRYRHYRAVEAKMKVEVMAGMLVRVERVEASISAMAARAVSRLQAIPDAVCSELQAMVGEGSDELLARVRKLIDQRIRETCEAIAEVEDSDLTDISPGIEELDDDDSDDGS